MSERVSHLFLFPRAAKLSSHEQRTGAVQRRRFFTSHHVNIEPRQRAA
jgi:hypothetical protein